MPENVDLHLHTSVSDGELEPTAMLGEAASFGLTRVSLTDHDSLGAYAWREGAVFAEAARLGIELVVGIEMDAELDGIEIHLLGYGVDRAEPGLRNHLECVRSRRFERARSEIAIVNTLLGPGTIAEADVFVPVRETLMKPHFIRPLLEQGLFGSYREANAWYRGNVRTGIVVPKPDLHQAIGLVKGAGGQAILAHPAYYQRDGVPILSRLDDFRAWGLDGIEVEYPYHVCTPLEFSRESEREFVEAARQAIERWGLTATEGSDAHGREDLRRVYAVRSAPCRCRSAS